jgi:hypothetical protein
MSIELPKFPRCYPPLVTIKCIFFNIGSVICVVFISIVGIIGAVIIGAVIIEAVINGIVCIVFISTDSIIS